VSTNYALEEVGAVEIESEWTVRRRQAERNAACKLMAIPLDVLIRRRE
jgi:hypothetical protein